MFRTPNAEAKPPRVFPRRGGAKPRCRPTLRPSVESLEGRMLLYSASAYHWVTPGRISFSFAPDGVFWDHGTNNLNATFNAAFPGQDWKGAFRRAFATWQAATNIEFYEVADGNYAWDATGRGQADERFGDIRIGGYASSNTTLLAQTYYPATFGYSGTGPSYDGNLEFNTSQSFSLSGGGYDLESVALHEIGHALGLNHSSAGTVMDPTYHGVARTLTADDLAGIQSMYGNRPAGTPRPGTTSDWDSDGKSDMGMFFPATATWTYNASRGAPAPPYNFGAGGYNDIPVPGDYDGVGHAQFATFRPSTAQWFITHPDGTQTGVSFGATNLFDIPVPGDYDGDGKTNLAVYRPSTAQWIILNANGTQTVVSYGWGDLNEIPVPGDYDGDGKTNIAMYRPSTAEWHILNADGGQTFISYGWGNLNEIPVPGDYDGDGKTNIAMYRPSNGEWHILNADGGQTFITYGGPGLSDRVPLEAPIGSLKKLGVIGGSGSLMAAAAAPARGAGDAVWVAPAALSTTSEAALTAALDEFNADPFGVSRVRRRNVAQGPVVKSVV